MSIKFENVVTPSPEQWKAIIMGARNPLNSWHLSDSCFDIHEEDGDIVKIEELGPNDHDLLMRLRNAGTDHRKFMRMITVYVDITAPLYWWKELDTYKVGTVANSCSTMHKIHAKEFTLDDFSHEHLLLQAFHTLLDMIKTLNYWRDIYLMTQKMDNLEPSAKDIWWQMIQLLPSSYNQKRTVLLNYEVLANIYKSRKHHKLDEWSVGFMEWIESLPYKELITGEEKTDYKPRVLTDIKLTGVDLMSDDTFEPTFIVKGENK